MKERKIEQERKEMERERETEGESERRNEGEGWRKSDRGRIVNEGKEALKEGA